MLIKIEILVDKKEKEKIEKEGDGEANGKESYFYENIRSSG